MTATTAPALFETLRVGRTVLPNRLVMAPLTRMRATPPDDLPNDLMRDYYVQRAGAGLIVTEGTQVSPRGKGYLDTPGIHSPAQTDAWGRIVDDVHAAGGRIAAQLWHVGRVSHASFHDGALPVAPSAIASGGRTSVKGPDGCPERVPSPVPHALTPEEIAATVEDYRAAARNARAAGFDLVEIHAAHGYLIHQFLSPTSNVREDAYGGTPENRRRFALEVVDAVVDGFGGADGVGIRISPIGSFNGVEDPDGQATGLALASEFAARDLAFLHLSEPDWVGGESLSDDFRTALRAAYPGPIVAAGGYDVAKAERVLGGGWADAIAFGRWWIANPDLDVRLRTGAPLNEPDKATFYGGGADGYTDYPTLR